MTKPKFKVLPEVDDAVTYAAMTWDRSEKTLVFYASRFTGDRPDKVGDVVDPRAFDNWYRRWSTNPKAEYPNTRGRLPIVWSHEWTEVKSIVGYAEPTDVTIDAKGLLVAAHLFDTPEAKRMWELARDMGLAASFSYDIAPGGEKKTTKNGKTFNLLTEFKSIMEAGPCLLGAEPSAGTVGVKSDDDLAVIAWDRLVKDMEPTSEMAAGPAHMQGEPVGEQTGGIVEPAYPRATGTYRCVGCQRFSTDEKHPAPDGLFRWSVCSNCGATNIFPAKSLPESEVIRRCKATGAWVRKNVQIIDTWATPAPSKPKKSRAKKHVLTDDERFELAQLDFDITLIKSDAQDTRKVVAEWDATAAKARASIKRDQRREQAKIDAVLAAEQAKSDVRAEREDVALTDIESFLKETS